MKIPSNVNALIIEDNPDDVELLASHLERVTSRQIYVESCDLLSTGLQRIAQGGIDIVFLDLTLPDSTGIDTLIRTTKLFPEVPVIILTGTDDDALSLQAVKSGAEDYLVKGQLNVSSLGRSINYAIERKRSFSDEQLFKAVVDSSGFAVIGKSLENIIVSWNIGAERLYGYKAEEIVGKPNVILVPPDRINEDLKILEKIKRGEHVDQYQTTRRRKDGSHISVLLSASPIKSSDDVITAVSVIARDITQQKLTEELLRESDERLKLSIRASRIGLWDWDLRYDIVRWDSGMYKLFGVIEGQFIPSFASFLGCLHADDLERVKETVENIVSTGGELTFDFRAVWADGTICYMECKGEKYCDEQGQPLRMSGACFDITARKLAEAGLHDSEKRLRLALGAAKMGVWDWDFATGNVWRSSRHDQIFGYESILPDWTYEMFLSHVVPADLAAVQQTICDARDNTHYWLECRITRANDGAIRWISSHGEVHKDEDGNAVGMSGTITDITDVKQMEHLAKDLMERNQRISQSIVQHAPIGIVVLDSEFKVSSANAAFVSMIHRDLEKLLNQPLTAIMPEQLIEPAEQFIQSGEQMRVARLQVAIPNQWSSLERHWDLSLWPVANDQGELTGAVSQVVDCTETVLLEQQRDDFVASIAHDIKNPLIGAGRILDLLCEQSQHTLPESTLRMLSVIRDGNRDLLALVKNLVDVYKYETLAYPCHYEDIDLKALIGGCIQQIADFAETRDVVVHNKVIDTISLQADAIGLRRVLMNLLHNAVKFNQQGGTVEVTAERLEDVIKLRVVDTGGGISDSDQQALFQRFGQGRAGKRYASGTGLGLYLSKQIVEGHHGSITCESRHGSGATFVILLPASKPMTKENVSHER
jgi:PAS domain S-box-containing protein